MRQIELPPTSSSPSRARQFVRAVFEEWGVGKDVTEDGALLVTETVTNAIVHGQSPVVVEISRGGHTLEVAVHDSGGGVVRLRDPKPHSVKGRGLRLVDRLASEWSVTEDQGPGKTVRFFLDTHRVKAGAPR